MDSRRLPLRSLARRAAALALAAACLPLAAQTLVLHFQERAPYSYAAADGQVRGLVAGPADMALRKAGISFAWTLTPGLRQLALIQSDAGLHCGLGWFRNPQREQHGKFSRALYRDQPLGALARADSPLQPRMSGATAMALGDAVLLVKEGYSYGARLDPLIARRGTATLSTSAEPAQMLQMLLAGRAAWMIVAPEEADELRRSAGPAAARLRQVSFTDAVEGPTRHLYCSRAVPDAWMARIDQALATL